MNPAATLPVRGWRLGIGGRLTAGFISVVGLAVGACLIGWFTFRGISEDVARFSDEQVPQLALAARLSRAGSEIGAAASALAGAGSRGEHIVRRRRYAAALATLEKLGAEVANASDRAFPRTLSARARETLAAIEIAAGKRFTLIEEMQSDLQQLRWMQADLISETGPLASDLRFNAEAAIRQDRINAATVEQRRSEALLSMVAQANLSIGVLSRVVGATNVQELQEANAFLGDSVDELSRHLADLQDWPDAVTVQQLGRDILGHADARNGVPNRKRTELREAQRLEALVAGNEAVVAQLGRSIDREVTAIERRADAAAQRTRQIMRTGSLLMASIAIIAIGLAVAIGYFYVGRSLLRRIRALADDAEALSIERSGGPTRSRGADELDDLAYALALFRQAQTELIQSAKLAALGQMAVGIGHELNQPLAAIQAHLHNVGTLLRRGEVERATASLDKIGGLMKRISRQIAHIRRFARKPMTELARVDLAAAVREAVALVGHRFEEEQATLILDLPEGKEILVQAELIRLEQVLVNLLANALDAVSREPERRISVGVEVAGEETRLSVTDTGPGIPEENRQAVFDPFFTTKPPGSGLGLGLSISFNILRDFGGALLIALSGKQGTEMRVILKTAA